LIKKKNSIFVKKRRRIPIPASFRNNHNANFHENAGCARDAGFRTSWSMGFAAYHKHLVGSCTVIPGQAGSVNI